MKKITDNATVSLFGMDTPAVVLEAPAKSPERARKATKLAATPKHTPESPISANSPASAPGISQRAEAAVYGTPISRYAPPTSRQNPTAFDAPVSDDGAIVGHGWKGDVAKLVPWFVGAYRRGQLPAEAFKLRAGCTISNPAAYYARLRATLAAGPSAITDRTVEDLARLHLIYRSDAEVPDMKLQVQVIHKGVPKLVGVVFKTGGRLICLHEATATQHYGPLASPGGVDHVALTYLDQLGVQEWHHWTNPDGPLWVTPIYTLLEEGIRQDVDGRDRHFLANPFWSTYDSRPYKAPWIKSAAVVLDPKTGGVAVGVAPSSGKIERNAPKPSKSYRSRRAAVDRGNAQLNELRKVS